MSEGKVSLIIATYNRCYALKKTISSYYVQSFLNEIIFVDDCSKDDTNEFIRDYSVRYPDIRTKVIRNFERQGQVVSRIIGYNNANSEYVLFCDDDEILEPNYTMVCLKIFEQNKFVGAVSGRRVYQREKESIEESIRNFEDNLKDIPYFDFKSFCFNHDAKLEDESLVPLTNSIVLTKRKYLLEYGFDNYYSKGNSYREESDFQATLLSKGLKVIVTNQTHSIHLNMQTVTSGGNRINRLKRFFWNSYFSIYFADKHFSTYKKIYNEELPTTILQFKYRMVISQIYLLFVKPLKNLFI